MKKRNLTIGLVISILVAGMVSLWPEEESPFHGWPGLVDITTEPLDFTPRYGVNDPASISTGQAAYWGRATDQDGNPLAGATVTAYLVVHFGHGHGPKHWKAQFQVADDGTFTVAGGSGIMLTITVAKPGHTPYLRRFELHPAKERFRPTKDAPEELIVWRNVGNGKRRNAEIETTVPWPLCRHFRLDFLQRKVVGPEEVGDLEIRLPLMDDPVVDGKLNVARELSATLEVVDGSFGFCYEPTSRVYDPLVGPAHWSWQPSDRHPLLNEQSIGGIRDTYAPFMALTFKPIEVVKTLQRELQFSEHSDTHGGIGGNIVFRSRKDQVAGRIKLEAFFTDKEPGKSPGYFVRIYGAITQGSRGWNEREPEPELLLPDPNP